MRILDENPHDRYWVENQEGVLQRNSRFRMGTEVMSVSESEARQCQPQEESKPKLRSDMSSQQVLRRPERRYQQADHASLEGPVTLLAGSIRYAVRAEIFG